MKGGGMQDKALDLARAAWRFALRYKVITLAVIVAAGVLFYGNLKKGGQTLEQAPAAQEQPGAQDSGGDAAAGETDELTAALNAFFEAYGCYSHLDAADTSKLAPLVGEGAAGEIAQERLAEGASVKVSNVVSLVLVSQQGSACLVQAEIDEYAFTESTGLAKAHKSLLVELTRSETQQGEVSYKVTRLYRQ